MNSKNPGQIIAIAIAIVIAVWASVSILLNPTGGISGLSKLLAIIGIVLGIMNPKAALFYLAAQAIYSDELKRIGVYFGVQSTQTISEILIGPLLTLTTINLSFIHGVLRRQFKLDALGWMLYMIAPVVGAILAYNGRDAGLSVSIYLAATTGLYITIVPICYGVFNSLEEWTKFVSWQLIVAAPAVIWGFWQYSNGFNQIEWSYVFSGLSRVHTYQMISTTEPRIFGLFGSASAYGCVGLYTAFAFWRTFRFKKHRAVFLVISLIYLTGAILSHQRSILLLPLIVLLFAIAFRRVSTTLLFYGSVCAIFIIGVINADYLVNTGLQKFNDAIRTDGRWAENVLNVGTFSDRLRGWERLGRMESWSMFGSGKLLRSGANHDVSDYNAADFNHDIINKILLNYGAVGMLTTLLIAGFIVFKLHQVIFKTRDWKIRKDGAFVMGCIIPIFIMSFAGGDNFSTTPINLQIWSVFAGIFLMRKITTT
jgi:hypothetical protein